VNIGHLVFVSDKGGGVWLFFQGSEISGANQHIEVLYVWLGRLDELIGLFGSVKGEMNWQAFIVVGLVQDDA
jgi:hypothetical protein